MRFEGVSMNILLIDDHLLFAEGIKKALEDKQSNWSVDILNHVPKCLKDILKGKTYDILLLDIHIKKIYSMGNGFDLAKELLRIDPSLKIIMLTGFDLPMYEKEAIYVKTKGFISKDITSEYLVKKIEEVYRGEDLFEKDGKIGSELTDGEIRVVEYYCSGMTRKEVAEKCNMSTSSLATILNRIYDKLGVRNYQQLYREAIKLGLVKMDFF